MKRALLSLAISVVFCATAASAQSTPQSDTQGTQSSSPSMSQGSSSSSSSGMSQGSQGMGHETKGEKKLKGCIQSEGGQTVLKEKSGKTVALTGQDLSAHVGHEVAVKGNWAGAGDATAASSGGGQFTVSSVDMISENCKMGGKSKGANTSNPQ
jgi:Protein of unknown function (DUF5818)